MEAVKVFYGDDLVSVAVFGSMARGTHHPESDLDLLIVSKNLPRGRAKRVLAFIEHVEEGLAPELRSLEKKGLRMELSPVIKTPDEVRFGSFLFLDMVDEALILYDREGFFRHYLDGLGAKLKTWGAKKVRRKGGYVWILKPDLKRGEVLTL